MTTKEISVARALVELKMTDARLDKAINQLQITSYKVGKKLVGGITEEDFTKEAKARLDQYLALLKNRQTLKAAIVKSNAITLVKIAEVEMTVAQAIERKSSIKFEKAAVAKLLSDFNKFTVEVNKTNLIVQGRLDDQAKSILGKDAKDRGAEYDDFVKTFLANNQATLIDPVGVLKKVEELGKGIEDFESDVDIALSESNAKTVLTLST